MANKNGFQNSRFYGVGLNNVGSYQMSGQPFISGSIDVPISGASNYAVVRFPRVTKSITIRNDSDGSDPMRVAFARGGLKDRASGGDAAGTEFVRYFKLSGSESFTADLRCTEVYLMGDTNVVTGDDASTESGPQDDSGISNYATIIAGLTNIYSNKLGSSSNSAYFGVEGIDDDKGL